MKKFLESLGLPEWVSPPLVIILLIIGCFVPAAPAILILIPVVIIWIIISEYRKNKQRKEK